MKRRGLRHISFLVLPFLVTFCAIQTSQASGLHEYDVDSDKQTNVIETSSGITQEENRKQETPLETFSSEYSKKEPFYSQRERRSLQVQLQPVRRTQYWLPCDTTPTVVSTTKSWMDGGGNYRRRTTTLTASTRTHIDDSIKQEYKNRRTLSSGVDDIGDMSILNETIGGVITMYGDELLRAWVDPIFDFSAPNGTIIKERQFFTDLYDIINNNTAQAEVDVPPSDRETNDSIPVNTGTDGGFFGDLADVPVDTDTDDGDFADVPVNTAPYDGPGFFGDLADLVPPPDQQIPANPFFGDVSELVPDTPVEPFCFFCYLAEIALEAGPIIDEEDDVDAEPDFEIDSCITLEVEDELLDFRDFLLGAEESLTLGGTGIDPYGDLVTTGYDLFTQQLEVADEEDPNILGINSLAVRPLSESVSGIPGVLGLEGEIFNLSLNQLESQGINYVNVTLFNASVSNIDTLVAPLIFAQPTSKSGQSLTNTFNFGPVEGKPLLAQVGIGATIDGGSSLEFLKELNIIEMSISTDFVSVELGIKAMVSAWYLFTITLNDLFEIPCWLGTFPVEFLGEDGFRLEGSPEQGLIIEDIEMDFATLDTNITCLNCTSRGFAILPELIEIIEVHIAETISIRLLVLFKDMALSEVVDAFINGVLAASPPFCPHRMEYQGETGLPNITLPTEFPDVSALSIDTVFFIGIIMGEIGTVFVVETLGQAVDNIPEREPPPPLEEYVYNSSGIPEDANLLDWGEPAGVAGIMIGIASALILGNDDDGSPRINGFLPQLGLLEDDGSFTIPGPPLPELFGLDIQVQSIKTFGLDNFTTFNGFDVAAPQTFNNEFELGFLTMQLSLSIDQPRTVDIPPQNFTMSINLRGLRGQIPITMAIDIDALNALEVGVVLNVENIFPCLLSTAYIVEIPFVEAQLAGFSEPSFEGLLPDTDIATKDSISAIYELNWTETLIEAVPYLAANFMQPLLQDQIQTTLNQSECPDLPSENVESLARQNNGFLDFRDFFLPPNKARILNGSGTNPYGDLGLSIYDSIEEIFTDGTINSVFIDRMTEAQSGVEGMLRYESDVFAFHSDSLMHGLLRQVNFRLFDAKAWNLDTVVPPVSILQPTTLGNVVENFVNFGPVSGLPLSLSTKLLISLDAGDDSPLTMSNEIEIGLSADSIRIGADLFMMVATRDFLTFPFKDVMNLNCWLALLPVPQLDDDGNLPEGFPGRGFAVSSFFTTVWNVTSQVACVDCKNSGLDRALRAFNLILNKGDDANDTILMRTLSDNMQRVVKDIVLSDSIQSWVNRLLHEAPQFCPHRPEFNESAVAPNITFPSEFPDLSIDSLESIVFAALFIAQTLMFVVIESVVENINGNSLLGTNTSAHSLYSSSSPDVASALDIPESAKLLDFTETDRIDHFQYGIGGVLQQARQYMGSRDVLHGDLRINHLLRDFFLNNDRVLQLEAKGLTYESFGFNVTLETIQIEGLDSITHFNVLDAVGPQTITNSLNLARLAVTVNASVDFIANRDKEPLNIAITFEVHDVNMTIPIYAAFDVDLLGSLELGSLLHTKDIIRCLLSPAYDIHFPFLRVAIGNILDPVIDGMSPDTAAVASKLMTSVFDQSNLQTMFPSIIDSVVRPLANRMFASYLGGSDNCPMSVSAPSYFVDLNQFFSRPVGTGVRAPYGDLPYLFKKYLDSLALEIDPITNTSKINAVLIAPLTKSQSGEVGTLAFPEKLFGVETNAYHKMGLDSIGIHVFDGRIESLDSLGAPLELLEPNATSRFLLDNRGVIGVGNDSFHFGVKVLLDILGDPAFQMRNELDFEVELGDASMFAVILAKIKAREILTFPLRHFLNIYCWMALFARLRGEAEVQEPRLALDYFDLLVSNMRFNVSCADCSSRGFQELPVLTGHLEVSGVLNVLKPRLILLALELFKNDGEGFLSDMLDDSVKNCPRYTSFETPVDKKVDFLLDEIRSLINRISFDSMETLVCSLTIMMQVFVVLVAETYADYGRGMSDPLAPQKELHIPTEVRVLDFTVLEESASGRLFNFGINLLNSYSTSSVVGNDEVVDNGINAWIRDIIGGRILSYEPENLGFDDWGISLSKMRVYGLDTFTNFNIFDVVGPQTFQSEFGLKRLHIELDLTVNGSGAGRNLVGEGGDDNTFRVSLALQDVHAVISVLMAVDEDKFTGLQFGSFLEMENIFPCLISSLHSLELSQLFVTVGGMELLDVTGFQSADIADVIEEFRELILQEYGETLLSAVPGIFDVMVRAAINNWLSFYVGSVVTSGCRNPSSFTSLGAFIDLRDLLLSKAKSAFYGGSGLEPYGNLVHTMVSRLQDMFEIDRATGLSGINEQLFAPNQPVSISMPFDDYSGTFNFSGDGRIGTFHISGDVLAFDEGVNVGGLNARVAIKVSDPSFENIDTFGAPLSVLELTKKQPFLLNNTISIGVGGRRPFRPSFRIVFDLQVGDETPTHNDFRVNIDLRVVTLIADAFLKIAEKRFMEFPFGSLGNYHCWLNMIPAPTLDHHGIRDKEVEPTATLKKLFLSIARIDVDLSCYSCTSPGLEDLGRVLARASASDDLTKAVNMGIRYISGLMEGDFLQDKVDHMLNLAARRCPHSPEYEADNTKLTYETFQHSTKGGTDIEKILLSISVAILMIIIGALVALVRFMVRRRHQKWKKTLSEGKLRLLKRQQQRRRELDAKLNSTKSMFESRDIPVYARYLVPIAIVGNIAFFLSGHLNLGGSVNLYADIFGEQFMVEGFFEFSIGKSTVDLWVVGARFTSMLVLLFSVVWPYAKQLTTLFLWFVSPKYLSTSLRGSLLVWLDTLAKWSMVDVMVMIISLAGFRTSIQSPEATFLPDKMYSFDLVVVPMWGLYANMIAQLISQISSHFIIFYHRKVVVLATEKHKGQAHLSCPIPSSATKSTEQVAGKENHASDPSGIDMNLSECLSDTAPPLVKQALQPSVDRDAVGRNVSKQNQKHCLVIGTPKEEEAAEPHSPQLAPSLQIKPHDRTARLFQHKFTRLHRADDAKLEFRRFVNRAVVLMAAVSCVCIVAACVLPAFSVDTFGVIGIFLALGENFRDTSRQLSAFGLVDSLMEETYFLSDVKDFVGLGSIAMLFLVTVLLVPLIQMILLLHQWFFPMTSKRRNTLLTVIEILQAWEYSEVYLFAVILETWQLGSVSKFMVNPFCDHLSDEFAMLSYYGILDKKDAQCFQIEGAVESGSFAMLVGTVFLILINTFVIKAALQYLREEDGGRNLFSVSISEENGASNLDATEGDLTTEDVRMESLSSVPVLFSDTFRWSLRGERKCIETKNTIEEITSNGNEGDSSGNTNSSGKSTADLSSLCSSSNQEDCGETEEGLRTDPIVLTEKKHLSASNDRAVSISSIPGELSLVVPDDVNVAAAINAGEVCETDNGKSSLDLPRRDSGRSQTIAKPDPPQYGGFDVCGLEATKTQF